MRMDQPRSAKYRCESAATERREKQNVSPPEIPESYPQESLKESPEHSPDNAALMADARPAGLSRIMKCPAFCTMPTVTPSFGKLTVSGCGSECSPKITERGICSPSSNWRHGCDSPCTSDVAARWTALGQEAERVAAQPGLPFFVAVAAICAWPSRTYSDSE